MNEGLQIILGIFGFSAAMFALERAWMFAEKHAQDISNPNRVARQGRGGGWKIERRRRFRYLYLIHGYRVSWRENKGSLGDAWGWLTGGARVNFKEKWFNKFDDAWAFYWDNTIVEVKK